MQTILIVDDERDIRLSLGGILKDEGFNAVEADSAAGALELIDGQPPELVILDLWMEEADCGFEVLEKIQKDYPDIPAIVVSGHGNVETAVKAVKLGAFDFIEKPLSYDKVMLAVERALNYRRLSEENRILRTKTSFHHRLTGQSPAIIHLMGQINLVAASSASVLITGENGTGKELVAQTIHQLSPRSSRPLIEVNCAAIPEELIESELFGHEKGSFTGAAERRRGRFDLANNSTLFLDEIGDMSLKTQAKILRILQEQKFERVGGTRTININVRVVAATNKNLEEEIEAGRFRQDLYYRLNVVPLHVPPLRERREDIPLLAEEFLTSYCRLNGLKPKTMSGKLLTELQRQPWPGNVRELKNTVERLVVMSPGNVIDVSSLQPSWPPASEAHPAPGAAAAADFLALPFKEAKTAFERWYLLHRLEEHQNNISQTAEAIELDRTNLHKKMKSLGLTNN